MMLENPAPGGELPAQIEILQRVKTCQEGVDQCGGRERPSSVTRDHRREVRFAGAVRHRP